MMELIQQALPDPYEVIEAETGVFGENYDGPWYIRRPAKNELEARIFGHSRFPNTWITVAHITMKGHTLTIRYHGPRSIRSDKTLNIADPKTDLEKELKDW